MKKLSCYLALTLLINPIVLSAKESFFIPLPYILSRWKVGLHKTSNTGTSIRYFLEHETEQNWTELVNVQFKERKLLTCSDVMQAMKEEAVLNKRVSYKVHSQTPNDLIYEKIFPSGLHELVRMIMTEKGLHRIAYVKRNAPFTETDRAQWMDRISKGTIEMTE